MGRSLVASVAASDGTVWQSGAGLTITLLNPLYREGGALLPHSEPKGGMAMVTDPLLRGAIDERTIAVMRLMLVLLALLSTYIDPAETTHYEAATYTILVIYLAYSITLLTLAVRDRPPLPAMGTYWADVCWDILLIGSSKGTNSI